MLRLSWQAENLEVVYESQNSQNPVAPTGKLVLKPLNYLYLI